jgi:hypothetical protein
MKIQNTNKIYSTELLREIVKFVRPSGISNFKITLKNCKDKSFHGWAYSSWNLITIKIGKYDFPHTVERQRGTGYLDCTFYTQTELLVHLIAHELRHLWQKAHPKGWRVYGAKGRYSERDADAYAIHKVREWRRK